MEPKPLLHQHPSLLTSLAYLVWPLLLIIGVWVLKATVLADDLHTTTALIITGVLLIFPLYAWVRKFFDTYVVLENSVYARKGLLSKETTEIRFVDIRAINVRQSVWDRICKIGQVGFSSAAGTQEEVTFRGVRNPEGVKRLVQAHMPAQRSAEAPADLQADD